MKLTNPQKRDFTKFLAAVALCAPLLVTLPGYAEKPEHVKQLRDTKKCRKCDLSGANLSGANLSGADLSYSNLSGANLSGVSLRGVNLSGVSLRGVNLSGVSLR
ncbi:pentapeptide repeat-containing protein, partial [Brasilonema octagenarum]